MMKRFALLACAFAVAACSGAPSANVVQPDVEMYQLVGPADLNYPPGQIEVQYALRITNRAADPIKLEQVQIQPVGTGGPYAVARWMYPLNRTIAPNATEDVTFWAHAYSVGNAYATDANAPVSLRAVAHFRSSAGAFRKIMMRTFSQHGRGAVPGQ